MYIHISLFLALSICIHIKLNMSLYWHLSLIQFHGFTLAFSPCLSETSHSSREKPGSHNLPFSHLHIQPMYRCTIVLELFIYTPMKQLVSQLFILISWFILIRAWFSLPRICEGLNFLSLCCNWHGRSPGKSLSLRKQMCIETSKY